MQNYEQRAIEKKGYEIAYALFRMAEKLGGRPFAAYVENHTLSFFDSAIYGNRESALKEGKILEYYLRLCGDTGLFHPDNIALVIIEIGNLNSAIAELKDKSGKIEPLMLHFSKPEPKEHREPKVTADIQKTVRPIQPISFDKAQDGQGGQAHREIEVTAEVINKEIEVIANVEQNAPVAVEQAIPIPKSPIAIESISAKPFVSQNGQAIIRQMAIVDKIRQFGNISGLQMGCRMKELQVAFPNVSERTLRYDLEKLMERGVIDRIGQSGPSTFYRVVVDERMELPGGQPQRVLEVGVQA